MLSSLRRSCRLQQPVLKVGVSAGSSRLHCMRGLHSPQSNPHRNLHSLHVSNEKTCLLWHSGQILMASPGDACPGQHQPAWFGQHDLAGLEINDSHGATTKVMFPEPSLKAHEEGFQVSAMDVSHASAELIASSVGGQWVTARSVVTGWTVDSAKISVSSAVLHICNKSHALLNWHSKNNFCGKCGAPTAPDAIGSKRICCSDSCGAHHYPRLDPVVIALVEHPYTDAALLGRTHGYAKGMYTCLSGFVDNCESVEDAVCREVFEEAGVIVDRVDFIQSQPWAIGRGGSCELMLGCLGKASSTDIIVQAEEMEDVRWVPRAEVASAVHDAIKAHEAGIQQKSGANGIWIPGPWAVAHQLIRHWVEN